jgi:formylglycine-generating enzyme required for sulfatase activity
MDRSEISNAEFQRFIAAGGYRAQALWPATMTVGGASLTRTQALARFVDRSGLPGPRFWTSGRFSDGQADHPVVGITWYEAAAYATWAGKALPTAAQWWRAALGEGTAIFPWGRDGANIDVRANLDGTATKGRGTMPLGMSPFGVEHLAGNAREWLADSTRGGDRRIVVGGSWQDPSYMFERSHAEAFSPGFSNDAIGFRLVRPLLRR